MCGPSLGSLWRWDGDAVIWQVCRPLPEETGTFLPGKRGTSGKSAPKPCPKTRQKAKMTGTGSHGNYRSGFEALRGILFFFVSGLFRYGILPRNRIRRASTTIRPMDDGITKDQRRRNMVNSQDEAERGSSGVPLENRRLESFGLPSRLISVILECSGPPFSGNESRGSMNRRLNHPSTFSNGDANMSLPQLPL